MATSEEISRVRTLAAVTENDSEFGDEYIEALIVSEGGVREAAATLWGFKAASYAELVDVSESGSTRKMSDLYKNALAMQTALGGGTTGTGSTASRPRTRPIVRPTPS